MLLVSFPSLISCFHPLRLAVGVPVFPDLGAYVYILPDHLPRPFGNWGADIEEGSGGKARIFVQELLGCHVRGLQSHVRGGVVPRGEGSEWYSIVYENRWSTIQELRGIFFTTSDDYQCPTP